MVPHPLRLQVLIGSFLLIAHTPALADNSVGKAPERGYLISVETPSGIPQKSGASAKITGRIQLDGKPTSGKAQESFLEQMKKNGVEARFYFPDFTQEITPLVSLSPEGAQLKFQFDTPSLASESLNTFFVQLIRTSDRAHGLQSLQAKIDRRILALNALLERLRSKKTSHANLSEIEKKRDRLVALSGRIAEKLSARIELLAERHFPLQVDNLVARSSFYSTVMGKFRLSLAFDLGSAIEGQITQAHARVFNLRKADESEESGDLRVTQFFWNGTQVKEITQAIAPQSFISFDFNTPKLSSENSNEFSIRLYNQEDDDESLGHKIASLAQKLPVASDAIPPAFLPGFKPASEFAYIQALEPISATLQDPFGRVDPGSIHAFLAEKKPDGSIQKRDLIPDLQLNSVDFGMSYQITGNINPLAEGIYSLEISGSDLAGNASSPIQSQFRIDRSAPAITLGVTDHYLTNDPNWALPITVVDLSPFTTVVTQNGVEIARSTEAFISPLVTLKEGVNVFEFSSVDAAGNSSETKRLIDVVLDTTAPIITELKPGESETLRALSFSVLGSSSEALLYAKLNGSAVSLSESKKAFSGLHLAAAEGSVLLQWEFSDLAGNIARADISAQIVLKILNGDLLSVIPSEGHLLIKGAAGAALPGANLAASSGFFNSAQSQALADGSFALQMKPFSEATVSATDPASGKTEKATVTFNLNTTLSGIVRDNGNRPLPGATVSLEGTDISVVTDASGVFFFANPIATGDHSLVVDGSTVLDPCTECGLRKFGRTSISISIGLSQSNVLQRPIFLTPLLLDGTETAVAQNAEAIVTSPHAPGVELSIPAGAAVFPGGLKSGAINIAAVPAEVSTIPVPSFAEPKEVLSLEPSGLHFTEPVEVTLPNDNELSPGVELVILSMNSEKGMWEVDGSAQVSEDGASVVTKPGQGITHFSQIMAVPLAPVVKQMESPELRGADSFGGALSTSFKLPSYRAIGGDIAPTLLYNSSWAHPSVMVSNIYDIPERRVTIERETGGSQVLINKKVQVENCHMTGPLGVPLVRVCLPQDVNLFATLQYRIKDNFTSWYDPSSIEAQFFAGPLVSEKVAFRGGPGGFPRMGVVSYGLDLVDPNKNQFLDSGIYPYRSSYEIRLKNTIIRSRTVQTSVWSNFGYDGPSFAPKPTDPDTRIIEQVFPQDITGNIVVQNESQSSAGRGWKIGGVQRIANPQSDQILLEEADGSTSLYGINNTISTLRYGSIDFINVKPDLTHWPYFYGASFSNFPNQTFPLLSNQQIVRKEDLRTYNGSAIEEIQIPAYSGSLQSYTEVLFGTCYLVKFSGYRRATSLFSAPDGAIFGIDGFNSTAFRIRNNEFKVLVGDTPFARFRYDQVDLNCYGRGLDCRRPKTFIYGIDVFKCSDPRVQPSGLFPMAGVSLGLSHNLLNKPSSIAPGNDGSLIITDTGNNRVLKMDPESGAVVTIAGNFQTWDLGDGRSATEASIYHPLATTYDSLGNLYIASERGFIRKVDTTGTISTFAGAPATQGGTLLNEAPASQMSFLSPSGLVVDDENGYLYVADTGNHRVVRIDLRTRWASVVAGGVGCSGGTNSAAAEVGDNGPAVAATLCSPTSLGLDDRNNLLVADSGHLRVRRVTFQNSTVGPIAFGSLSKDHSKLVRNSDGTWTRSFRNGTEVHFDQLGRQIEARDLSGRSFFFNYDNSTGYLSQMVDSFGRITQYQYSGGKLTSITDPANRTTTFAYDLGGNLTLVVFPDGSKRSYTYDPKGIMLSETNERGVSTFYTYNAYNRIQSVSSSGQPEPIVINDSKTVTALNGYSGGNVAQVRAFGESAGQVYDGIVDAKQVETKFIKDYQGFITKIIDANGKITEVQRDQKGKPTLIKRPDGSEVEFTYDVTSTDENRVDDLLSKKDSATGITTSWTYDPYGNVLTETNGRGFTSTSQYNPQGLLISKSDPLGHGTTYSYNSDGLPNFITDSRGKISSFTYDSFGNRISATDPLQNTVRFTYDLAGNALSVTDAKGQVSTKEYDSFNRLTAVITPKGERTEYSYLPTGELEAIKDPKGKISRFEYDFAGRLISKTDPNGRSITRAYDANGNLIREVDPKGAVKEYSYNTLNQMVRKTLPDDTVDLAYDLRGNLSQATNSNSEIYLDYDSIGRLISSRSKGRGSLSTLPDVTLQLSYDENGNRKALMDPTGTTTYSHDQADRLTDIVNHKGEAFRYSYDPGNRVSLLERPGGRTQLEFDDGNFVARVIHSNNSGATLSSLIYQNDPTGNKTSITTAAGTSSLLYDQNRQLTSFTNPEGSEGFGLETFSYDSRFNRATDQLGNYTYDSNGELLVEDYRYRYFYDENGNLTSKQAKNLSGSLTGEVINYSYSSENQLLNFKVYGPGSLAPIKEVSYAYDVLGRRIQKQITLYSSSDGSETSSTRKYIYDGQELLLEYNESNQLLAKYTHSGLRTDDILAADITSDGKTAGLASSEGSYQYLKDVQGTITDVTDNSGRHIQHYVYSAFGILLGIRNANTDDVTSDAPLKTAFTFTGREYDSESGLYYYRARYYDPGAGRFLQKDPHPGKISIPGTVVNGYTYVLNSPTNLTDPSGEIPPLLVIAGAGLLGGIINMGLNNWTWGQGGKNFFKGFLGGIALASAFYGVAYLLAGSCEPGFASYIGAGILGAPAAYGLFDPNATTLFRIYSAIYLFAGSVGNYLQFTNGITNTEKETFLWSGQEGDSPIRQFVKTLYGKPITEHFGPAIGSWTRPNPIFIPHALFGTLASPIPIITTDWSRQ